jgi:hypothetical protein
MPECVHADLETIKHVSLLLLKPRSLTKQSTINNAINSAVNIPHSIRERNCHIRNTETPGNCTQSIPKTRASWLLGPVSVMVAIHLIS